MMREEKYLCSRRRIALQHRSASWRNDAEEWANAGNIKMKNEKRRMKNQEIVNHNS
jgi:hypothetical protein